MKIKIIFSFFLRQFILIFFIFLISLSTDAKKKNINLNKIIKGMFVGEDLDPKYGLYEKIKIPESIYSGPTQHIDIKRKSVQNVLFRFVKKKSSLSQYPNKAIEGIVWLELMYNEMIRHPKSVQPETIREIWQARQDIRKSMGFSEDLTTQEVVDRYVVLSLLLKDAEVEKQTIDNSLKKRKDILQNFKSDILKAKKDYLNSMDDKELAKFHKKNPLYNYDDNKNNIQTIETKTLVIEPKISVTTDEMENKLIQLKNFYNKGLISEEEYKTKKQELLNDF